jgi:hypothetical protein
MFVISLVLGAATILICRCHRFVSAVGVGVRLVVLWW